MTDRETLMARETSPPPPPPPVFLFIVLRLEPDMPESDPMTLPYVEVLGAYHSFDGEDGAERAILRLHQGACPVYSKDESATLPEERSHRPYRAEGALGLTSWCLGCGCEWRIRRVRLFGRIEEEALLGRQGGRSCLD